MPFPSEVATIVLFVSLFTRVTVAPEITAPWESLTVPRREPRYCAWAADVKTTQQDKINKPSGRSLELFMTFSSVEQRFWANRCTWNKLGIQVCEKLMPLVSFQAFGWDRVLARNRTIGESELRRGSRLEVGCADWESGYSSTVGRHVSSHANQR